MEWDPECKMRSQKGEKNRSKKKRIRVFAFLVW